VGCARKFVNKLFTATVVRASWKNAGIAGPALSHILIKQANAALAAVAKKSIH